MTEYASELPDPGNGMTLAQIREAAVVAFGPGTVVDYAENEGWVIRTAIPEVVDPSVFAGTPAAENGHAGSVAIGAEEYNKEFAAVPTPEMIEAADREDYEMLRDYMERDNDFSNPELAAHRDEVLAKARGYGWILEVR